MNAHAPLSAACSTDSRVVFERQIAMLGELAEVGLEVVHAIRDQAVEAAAEGAASTSRIDFGLAYTRAARAVRMTLALQRRYILDLQFQDRFAEPPPFQPRATPVERIRHGLAAGGLSETEAVERLDLAVEAADLLDVYEDLADDIPAGSFEEIVARICKDLGLAAPPSADFSGPFPLEGVLDIACDVDGRAGMGVNAQPPQTRAREAAPRPPFPVRSG